MKLFPNLYRAFCFILLVDLFAFHADAQVWQSLGPDDFNNASLDVSITCPSMGLSYDGVPYVYATEQSSYGYRGTLRAFKNGQWTVIGQRASTNGMYYNSSLVFDTSGNFYSLVTSAGGMILKKTTPAGVSTILNGAGLPGDANLATSPAGDLYAYYNSGPSYATFVSVKKYNGAAFSDVGTVAISPTGNTSTIPVLRFSRTNVPFVAYRQSSSNNVAVVKQFNGTSWITVGTNNASLTNIENLDMAIDTSGNPYIIYSDNGGGTHIASYSGSTNTWSSIGTSSIASVTASSQHIIIGANNKPVIYYYNTSDWLPVAMSYSGGVWTDMNSISFRLPHMPIMYYSLAVDKNSIPYLYYANQKSGVMKFNGTSWEDIGTPGFSRGKVTEVRTAISNRGVTYSAYVDLLNNAKFTVQKFSAGQWVDIAPPTAMITSCNKISLKCDTAGMPVIAYLDGYQAGSDVVVKRYNGSSWTSLASPAVSGMPKAELTMALDKNGTPYIAFNETAPGTVYVLKYNGSGWDTVGHGNASDGWAYYPSLAIDDNMVPYLAYQNRNIISNEEPVVRRFTNGAWTSVGTAAILNSKITEPHVAIGPGNVPYLSYIDFNNNEWPNVKRFNGVSWVNTGSGNWINNYPVIGTDFTISRNGYLYFSYRADTGRAYVRMLQGNNWIQLGSPAGISAGAVGLTSIDVDTQGYALIVYDNFNLFAKKYNTCLSAPRALAPVCDGGNLYLCANPSLSYSWSGPNGFTSSVQYPVLPVSGPSQNGYYRVTINAVNGCTHTDSVLITINALPPFITPAISSAAICPNDSALITVPSGYFTIWKQNGMSMPALNDDTAYTTHTAGHYEVLLRNIAGCTRYTDSVRLTVYPGPSPVIQRIGNTLHTGTYSAYQWLLNGNLVSGGTSNSLVAVTNGTYSVRVTDINGCTNTSATLQVVIQNNGLNQLEQSGLTIGPNPVSGILHIRADKNILARLYNMQGYLIEETNGRNSEMKMSHLPNGIYQLVIRSNSNENMATYRIIKQE